MPVLKVDKDVEICSAGGPIRSQAVTVDPATKGIADVLVYLHTEIPSDDPKWIHPDYDANKDAVLDGAQAFDQKECVFLSHVFAMRSTQSVVVKNSDRIGHNTKISPAKGAGSVNESIPGLGSFTYSPGGESPQPFPVSCSIHPWMSAWMITRDSPYFAVSGKDGSFEIKNVPAGVELEFRFWQPQAQNLKNVTVNGEAMKLSKGRYKVQLEPGADLELNVVINAAELQ